MKIVKYIFLLLLLAAIAGTVFIATQEGKYDITKEQLIKVPRNVLYNYVNDYENWQNAPIFAQDTTAVFTLSDNTSNTGASAEWTYKGNEGTIKTLRTAENDSIIQKAVINSQDSEVRWGFKDTLDATKVTLRMKGRLTFTEKAYSLLQGGIEDKIGQMLDNSLHNINRHLVDELNTFDIKVNGIVIKPGTYYIGQYTRCKISEMESKMASMMPNVVKFVKTNNIETNGNPFTLFETYDTATGITAFTVCVPLKEEMFTSEGSEFRGGKIEPFNALKTTLKGDYSHLKKAWDAAFKHIAKNQLEQNFEMPFLEVYTKGMQQTKHPSQWVTDIYIPIGPALQPEVPAETTVPVSTPAANPANVTPTVKPVTAKPAATSPALPTVKKPAKDTTAKKPAKKEYDSSQQPDH